jgi:histidinol-phosphate aminotransferase
MEVVPAPKVVRAIRDFDLRKSAAYFGGYYGSDLRPELARRFALPKEQISVGYGAEFFLRAIFDACDPKKEVVLVNAPHYTFYAGYARLKKIRLATFPLVDRGDRFEFDIDDCLSKIRAIRPKVVLITSPNNPTGNSIAPRDLEKVLRATNPTAKSKTLVVLDEAYWGFDDAYDEHAFLRLLKKYDNLVMLRSFSKRYALAGLRIGFALWGKRAKDIIRYDDLYLGGSRLLEDIALAALKSESYYRAVARRIIVDRVKFIRDVNNLQHFTAYDSQANFVLVKIDKKTSSATRRELDKLDVAISKFISPEFMRVSLGSHRHIAEFTKTLRNVDALS